MARVIYDEYPSVTDLVRDADIDSLQKLDGIGPETASKIMGSFL
jgi:Holliday junction resolvasome RuvABC DNA-binding subunit